MPATATKLHRGAVKWSKQTALLQRWVHEYLEEHGAVPTGFGYVLATKYGPYHVHQIYGVTPEANFGYLSSVNGRFDDVKRAAEALNANRGYQVCNPYSGKYNFTWSRETTAAEAFAEWKRAMDALLP